ncbi:MAG: hypothetical protein QUS12_09460, partial [Methanosarcina sp.]|nr:hypothetical protein [Methanosarcina sp.]
ALSRGLGDVYKRQSDYSNEPEDNGDRINIGRYGNTEYASISGTAPESESRWEKVVSPAWKTFRIILRAFFLVLP